MEMKNFSLILPNNYPTNTYEKNRNRIELLETFDSISIINIESKSNRIIDYRNISAGNSKTTYLNVSYKDYSLVQYFSLVDCAIQHISDRFDELGMKFYCQLESLLLSAYRGEELSDLLTNVFNIDDKFDKIRLEFQLHMLPTFSPAAHLHAVSGQTRFITVTSFNNFSRRTQFKLPSQAGLVSPLPRPSPG
jgi:hypothetical protein